MSKYGFRDSDWNAAKKEVKDILVERAKAEDTTICYSELVSKINSIEVAAHDSRLDHLLEKVCIEEDVAGRGMLTVIVVHKNGDKQPGPGFFKLAKSLGRDTTNIVGCWIKELNKVKAFWST